jgi:23S rRNA (cytosine1962-C5)-methyltransferase
VQRGPWALPARKEFPRLIAQALERRQAVSLATDAYRVVDDAADGLPGVVVDRYGDFGVLSPFSEEGTGEAPALADALLGAGLRGVYVKRRVRTDLRKAPKDELAPEAPLRGEPAPPDLVVTENGVRFHVDLTGGLSTGLFTDQRDTRALVCESAAGARVLNLFAYTCSFTVAAALGGASATTSVDLSQRALKRGHENLVLNGVSGSAHRLLRSDAVSFVGRARRRGDRFDIVIVDPPSFGTQKRGTFSVERDYAKVAEDSFAALAPGGRLVAVTNHLGTTRAALHAIVRKAAAANGVRIETIADLPMPADYCFRPDGQEPTKTVVVTLSER